MSGREAVAYVGSLHPAEARPSKARIQEVIDLVGIADAADRPSTTYSGGMRPIRRPYRYAVDGTSDDD
jgi:ABC-2 type transport system ATP-binding protein